MELVLLLVLGTAPVFRPASTALAQEEEDLAADTKAMRKGFDRARERLDNLDFTGAARELSAIIEPRKDKPASSFSTEELRLLCAAYDMRARSQFNLGSPRGAEADF